MTAHHEDVTRSKTPRLLLGSAVVALALVASCSSEPLVPEDGGAGERASGGSGAGMAGADGGASVAGSEGGDGGAVGCYPGRELVGGVMVVACSPDPRRLVLGPSEVYWLDWDGGAEPPAGTILGAPKDGGAFRLLGSAQDSLAILQTDGEEIFWTDHRDDYKDGVLRSASIAGETEAVLVDHLYLATALALDEGHVYFGTVAEVEVDGIARVPKTGGLPEVLVSGSLVGAITSTNGELYWVEVRSDGFSSVYRAAPDDAAAPTLLAEGDRDDPMALVTTDDYVFWTFGLFGEVWRVGRDGADAAMLAAGNADTWSLGITLATDGASLYFSRSWNTPDAGTSRDALVRSSLDGNGVVELTRAVSIVDQAVDDEFVYFTGTVEGSESQLSGVFRVSK